MVDLNPYLLHDFRSLNVIFSPDEALLALAKMHNYAPEEFKVTNSIGSKLVLQCTGILN